MVLCVASRCFHATVLAGGHRHNVDQGSVTPIGENTAWLVGGGGGWSCDGGDQGFVVGEIAMDGSIQTRSVLVDSSVCCPSDMMNRTAHNNKTADAELAWQLFRQRNKWAGRNGM